MSLGKRRAAQLLVALGLMAAPYIDWEASAQIAGWHANVPVADLVALLALALALAQWNGSPWAGSVPLLGGVEMAGWAGLLGVGLVSAHNGADLPGEGPDGLHTLLRKTLFLLLAWRVGFASLVGLTTARGGPAFAMRWLTASSVLCALVLAGSSVARILAGKTLWWATIEGVTNNHKTLAVYLAPTIPLAWMVSPVAVALLLVAIGLSWSKSAWVTAAFAVGWVMVPRRLRLPVLGLGTVGALVGVAWLPYLARSPEQIDSLNSRMSLNKRAWEMFLQHPWVGWGPGSNVRYEITTYPDYRVNGVDAHGAFAKLGSEFGVLGLSGWLLATAALLWRFRRRAHRCGLAGSRAPSRLDDVLLGTILALHLNLLTSTETFSQTHWAILGLICGLAARRR